MNQEKIGKFIAQVRKERKLTQSDIAKQLGVSVNAVSKWERGICLMDMSLLQPLSEFLEVSVNEILTGEYISDEKIKEKSEENIINLTQHYDLKATRKGVMAMLIVTSVLIVISLIKGLPIFGYTAIVCSFSSIFQLCQYKFKKDKTNLITGGLFLFSTGIYLFISIYELLIRE